MGCGLASQLRYPCTEAPEPLTGCPRQSVITAHSPYYTLTTVWQTASNEVRRSPLPTGGISQSVKEEFPHGFEGTDLQTKITGRFKKPRLAALVQEAQLFRCGTQYPFQLLDCWKAFTDCTRKHFFCSGLKTSQDTVGKLSFGRKESLVWFCCCWGFFLMFCFVFVFTLLFWFCYVLFWGRVSL